MCARKKPETHKGLGPPRPRFSGLCPKCRGKTQLWWQRCCVRGAKSVAPETRRRISRWYEETVVNVVVCSWVGGGEGGTSSEEFLTSAASLNPAGHTRSCLTNHRPPTGFIIFYFKILHGGVSKHLEGRFRAVCPVLVGTTFFCQHICAQRAQIHDLYSGQSPPTIRRPDCRRPRKRLLSSKEGFAAHIFFFLS